MDIKELKETIRKNIKWEVVNPTPLGGQSCGIPQFKQRLCSEELDFKVEIGYMRSAIKNREMCVTLFELYMDEIIK